MSIRIAPRLGALVSVLALMTAGFAVLTLTAPPAGATTVTDQTSFVTAFNNASETTITFANDITLSSCGSLTDRNSTTALSIDGGGFELINLCGGTETLHQEGNGALNITNLTISGGSDGIGTFGPVTLSNSAINTVTSPSTSAFGIDAVGAVTLISSSVTDTTATGSTGDAQAVDSSSDVTLTNSTISGTVASSGGDTYGVDCSGDVTLTNSTISGTSATEPDGEAQAVDCSGGATLTGSQIVNTTASSTGQAYGLDLSDDATLTSSSIANTSGGEEGFGIDDGGVATLTDSSITNTSGSDEAIAVDVDNAVTLVRSTIAGTSASDFVAAIDNDDTVTVTNSTITNNTGLAIDPGGAVTIVYSDIVGNGGSISEASVRAAAPDSNGRGPHGPGARGVTPAQEELNAQIDHGDEAVSVFASVISNPQAGFVNCSGDGTVTSEGYNFSDDTTCNLTGTGDHQASAANPQLAALADNGGPTPTLLPADASPLVDAIPVAACSADGASTIVPLTDQRSLPRPAMIGCDIGSVELQPPPPPVVIAPAFTG